MKRQIDVTPNEARTHFLKVSSYFKNDSRSYIGFESILNEVHQLPGGKSE